MKKLAAATLIAFLISACANTIDPALFGLFSSPETAWRSKKIKREGEVWQLKQEQQLDPRTIAYTFKGRRYILTDYLAHTSTTALLIVKDGEVLFETYQHGCKPSNRFLSASMAKTITAMLIGIALEEGKIKSLDDTVETYVPELRGTGYGKATIRHLLTMTSGVKWEEDYVNPDSDFGRFTECLLSGKGCASSLGFLRQFNEQANPPGSKFHYSSAGTMVLGYVLRAATKQGVTSYTQEKLWSKLGAEDDAAWMTDRDGIECVFGRFAATLRDYGRLGMLMANQGARETQQIVPLSYWKEMISAPPVESRAAGSFIWYGYQLWLTPNAGVFSFVGLRGQRIQVDVKQKLVMVRLAVAGVGDTDDSLELVALWEAVRRLR
jgi:CubicO group peptidase (beta-lactamase class C family)